MCPSLTTMHGSAHASSLLEPMRGLRGMYQLLSRGAKLRFTAPCMLLLDVQGLESWSELWSSSIRATGLITGRA